MLWRVIEKKVLEEQNNNEGLLLLHTRVHTHTHTERHACMYVCMYTIISKFHNNLVKYVFFFFIEEKTEIH